MAMRDLIPWSRPEATTPALYREDDRSPFLRLRQEVDRLFDDMFRSPAPRRPLEQRSVAEPGGEGVGPGSARHRRAAGHADKDIELTVHDGVLAIKGERKSESEDRDRGWSERYYGRFERRIALPDGADEAHCDANFRDGVLTVRIPKSAEATRGRRIRINADTRH